MHFLHCCSSRLSLQNKSFLPGPPSTHQKHLWRLHCFQNSYHEGQISDLKIEVWIGSSPRVFIAPACSRVRYRRPIVRPSVRPSARPSVRLSTFMSTFDIYVKVSILINYKTKQPSNLAWNISLTSWLCDIGVRFSVCLSIRPSVCQHLCRSSTFMSKLVF